MARLCPGAFPKGPRTGKAPVRGNISPACIQIQLVLARYARHASRKPRRAPLGNAPREHLAAKGRFRRPKPSDHARRTNLAALRWTCPCAGAPARATAPRDRPSTAWPMPRGGAYPPWASPIPATRCNPPLALQTQPNTPSWARCSFRRKGTEHVKELRYGRGSLGSATSSGLPSRVARHALVRCIS